MTILKSKLLDTMNSPDERTWYTVKDLEELTGDPAAKIIETINSNEEFVQSNHLGEDNLCRFSTRKLFDEKVSFFDKLKGAFKNTTD